MKDADKQAKHEKKALAVSWSSFRPSSRKVPLTVAPPQAEGKARKQLEKISQKEHKYKQGLEKAQKKYNDILNKQEKARLDLQTKTREREQIVQQRQPVQAAVEEQKHVKAAHEVSRVDLMNRGRKVA